MLASAEEVLAGQAIYTKSVLHAYNLVVRGASNRLVWRCPTARRRGLYDRRLSMSHLDVGVGTGYFFDRRQFPTKAPRVALMDLNQNALDHAAQRNLLLEISARSVSLRTQPAALGGSHNALLRTLHEPKGSLRKSLCHRNLCRMCIHAIASYLLVSSRNISLSRRYYNNCCRCINWIYDSNVCIG